MLIERVPGRCRHSPRNGIALGKGKVFQHVGHAIGKCVAVANEKHLAVCGHCSKRKGNCGYKQ
jgi:hypothetical protein